MGRLRADLPAAAASSDGTSGTTPALVVLRDERGFHNCLVGCTLFPSQRKYWILLMSQDGGKGLEGAFKKSWQIVNGKETSCSLVFSVQRC